MTILDTDPTNYANLSDEVEEQSLNLLASFIDKVWARLDTDEPSIEDYYNF